MSLLLSLILAAAPAASAAPQAIPRKVLALYRKSFIHDEHKDVAFLPSHRMAETALNWLGLEVEHVDMDAPLPDPRRLGARGVLAWMPGTQALPDPRPLCRWLDTAMRSGTRVVFLGQLGLERSGAAGPVKLDPDCRRALAAFGVEYGGLSDPSPLEVKTLLADGRYLGFERKPDPTESGSLPLIHLKPGATAYLSLSVKGVDGPVAPVAVTARGGLALDPFALYSNESLSPARHAWVIDPFAFFASAFALQGLPRPDPTTLNGRRVYLSQVDGDGFFNVSQVDPRKTSGQLFIEEFLDKRPRSPFTVSLIAGYYDLALYQDAGAIERSRRALDRRNVEPAVHGYSHPLDWAKGVPALKIPGYEVDPVMETAGAARLIDERILPEGKRAGLFLWTGDCLPGGDAVRAAGDAGLINMNGGGGRFDGRFPSYAYLQPLSRLAGGARQVYAPANNENEFTDLWTGRYYGYRDAVVTFERSGAPRRVKPVDVYPHFYSAEKYAALRALHQVYDWAHSQPLNPVFAGEYVRSVLGFFGMRLSRLGPGRFLLEGGADLRTVRFDDAAGVPDLAASRGVLGYKRELGSLYVHLDGSASREIVLAPAPPRRPYLEEANFSVDSWELRGEGVRFLKRGWWTSEAVLAGLAPGRTYAVKGAGLDARLPAGPDGRLRLAFPDSEAGGPAREVTVAP